MARLTIKTVIEFYAAMDKRPSLRVRLTALDTTAWQQVRSNSYAAWQFLREACDAAIREGRWADLREMFALYEGVERAGKKTEMEGSYVAFVEDLYLPEDTRDRDRVLQQMGPRLREAIERDRRFGRG